MFRPIIYFKLIFVKDVSILSRFSHKLNNYHLNSFLCDVYIGLVNIFIALFFTWSFSLAMKKKKVMCKNQAMFYFLLVCFP